MPAVQSLLSFHRLNPVSSAIAALTLALLGAPESVSAATAARPSPAELVEQLRHALPPGSTLTPTTATSVPGWQSLDPASATVQVQHGGKRHIVSLVPLDWIGVEAKGHRGDIVRRGPTARVIVAADPGERLEWLDTFAPDAASLASPGGTTAAFAGQYLRVESEIRSLLRRSNSNRDRATASLIALGVPAEDLIRDAATNSRSPARLAAVRALRHFPGKATREALFKVIADRSRDASADRCRLAAMDTCAALIVDTHGPAVVVALQIEKDEGVVVHLASEINRLRYAPAAPELRRWLKLATSMETKIACARALATLRDPAAVAEIQAAIEAPGPRRAAVAPSALAAARHQLALELHRLAGDWGPETNGMRLSVVLESPDRVVIHAENMGEATLHFIPYAAEGRAPWPIGLGVTLDAAEISPPGPRDADLGHAATLAHGIAPGTSLTFELQLRSPVSPESEHTVAATWFGVVANELIVRTGTP